MGCAIEKGTFICGPKIEACPICGGVSLFLCDYPMGKGETCDIKLCDNCASEVGKNFHLCPVHYAEFTQKCIGQKNQDLDPLKKKREERKAMKEEYDIWVELGSTLTFDEFSKIKSIA